MSHLTQNTRPFFILEELNAVWLTTFSLTPMPGTVSFRSPEKEKRVWLWKRVRGCLQNINLQSGRIQGCFKVENIITWNPPITTLFGWVLWFNTLIMGASLVAQRWRICLPMQETWSQSLGREDPLAKETTAHSSILAWIIPWTEERGRLQSMRLQKSWTWLDLATKQQRGQCPNCVYLLDLKVSDHWLFSSLSKTQKKPLRCAADQTDILKVSMFLSESWLSLHSSKE